MQARQSKNGWEVQPMPPDVLRDNSKKKVNNPSVATIYSYQSVVYLLP